MPVSTSLSASSLADSSGARTQMASVVTGVVVVLTLLIFAPLFSDLPKPVLAAIIIDAVVFGMMDVAQMRRLWRISRFDFWIAVLAIVGVLTAGVLAGVIIGIILSLGWLVYINAKPPLRELARRPGSTTFRALEDFPDYETYDGLLIIRFDGGMYFVTTEVFVDQLRERVEAADPPIDRVVIDFESVNFLDSQGSERARPPRPGRRRPRDLVRFARLKTAVRTHARRRRGDRSPRARPRPLERRRRRERSTRRARHRAPAGLNHDLGTRRRQAGEWRRSTRWSQPTTTRSMVTLRARRDVLSRSDRPLERKDIGAALAVREQRGRPSGGSDRHLDPDRPEAARLTAEPLLDFVRVDLGQTHEMPGPRPIVFPDNRFERDAVHPHHLEGSHHLVVDAAGLELEPGARIELATS